MPETFILDGRTYEMAPMSVGERCAADLRERGYDGTVWLGVSPPTGRQRKVFERIFYRTPAGTFDPVFTA